MTLQSVPILPEPVQFAGDWVISAAEVSVAVTLSTRPAAASAGAPAWALETRGSLEALGLRSARAWRPAPDGIALVAADGATVAFFSTEGAGLYVHRTRAGDVVLSKTPG